MTQLELSIKVAKIKANPFKRLLAPTPAFFKKIIYGAIALGGIGSGIIALPSTGVVVPQWLLTLATYMITVGAVATIVAKFTVDDVKVKEDAQEKAIG